MNYLNRIQMSDLKGEHRELAEVIGLENFIQLVKMYGGMSIYIPKAEGLEKSPRNEQIRSEFTGYNYRQLASKYDLSEVSIRNIVSELDRKMKNCISSEQLSFLSPQIIIEDP